MCAAGKNFEGSRSIERFLLENALSIEEPVHTVGMFGAVMHMLWRWAGLAAFARLLQTVVQY